ncbi:DNA polymerase I [Candidatus Methylopumilus turicensis]|uniref:DNA polymerase I n=1 Tax=Candidatus Methylopumilus turicensis TaxID=1581680 RepID=A0A0B7IW82_9PROT|nr:DNA polymerase I [Candidatus Methylopumilus turicensis]CEN55347.1 fused DNA polymerase I 5'->3' exonuclease; 3'->5' polymerase; 3'->5' exonuclease [Candidatus Methylopumilus turicensis]
MKTLLLVDGSSYLYRAFHAMPDLRNRQNEPTGAIQGVLNMLRRLHKEYPADYSACIFDAKGKTFRDDIYPEYKANRASMPDDLRAQVEPLHEAIKAMGWPLIMEEGVEADDVIGALAKQAEREGIRVIISTGDKDIAQLVNEHVTIVNTMSNEVLDIAGVTNKFGLPPERIIDYLTLIGDTSDNVPGVEKVGPKTAVKWLTQYGTLDNIVAHADEITGVVGENLRKALPWIPTARELITIRCDVGIQESLGDLAPRAMDKNKLAELFEHFDFKSWRRELDSMGGEPVSVTPLTVPTSSGDLFAPTSETVNTPPTETTVDYTPITTRNYATILSEADLDVWLDKINQAKLVCFDTETTSLDPMTAKIVGMSFSIEAGSGAYLPLTHDYFDAPAQLNLAATLAKVRPILENSAIKKVGQNLKYDQHVLANHGIALRGIAHDTLLQSYVFESHKTHNMDDLAMRHLGIKTISFDEIAGKGAKQVGFNQVTVEVAAAYAAEDADITLQLHQAMYPVIQADDKLDFIYSQVEMPSREVLFTIERNGVLIDQGMLNRQSNEIGMKLMDLEKQAFELAGQPFNLASPKQLQEILFGKLGIKPTKKTPSGAPSTDEDVLQELALDYPLPKVLLEYRGLAKLKSTYTDKLPKMINTQTGRVHTSYNQAVAITGRLASSDPNLQNIPVRTAEGRRIREAFIAPTGSVIVSADYSQIELRIMAHLSQDDGMLSAFANNEDIHRATAAEIFGCEREAVTSEQRRYAKVINFGLIYGMSAFGLAQNLNIDRSAAQSYIERYFARYPGVRAYMQDTRELAKQKGYVETYFGRRLWVPEINSSNGMRRAGAERAAINAPMQGTAADLIKLAMIAVQNWIAAQQLQTKLIMQVHDELVLEVPEAELDLVKTMLPQLMQNVAKLDVPLLAEVGVGNNWEAAH